MERPAYRIESGCEADHRHETSHRHTPDHPCIRTQVKRQGHAAPHHPGNNTYSLEKCEEHRATFAELPRKTGKSLPPYPTQLPAAETTALCQNAYPPYTLSMLRRQPQ